MSGRHPGDEPGQDRHSGTIRLPGTGGTTFPVHPVPLDGDCDHRFEVPGHDPSPLLRHLVHIRDGSCVEPGCARSAVRCDFEHSVPFGNSGRTYITGPHQYPF